MGKVTTAIFWNRDKKNMRGEHPVSIRVTYQRKRKYFSTRFAFTEKEWERIQGESPRGKYKEAKRELNKLEERAISIIENLYPFTFDRFENKFTDKSFTYTIAGALERKANKLRDRDRINTAVQNECAMSSIEKFYPNLKFADLTRDLLENYENWMLEQGKSITTVSMYLRAIRAVYNDAIDKDIVSKELYPFGSTKSKYQIPTAKNTKKALTIEQIAQIMAFEPDNPITIQMRDYWLFLYLCNGINVKDFCLLQYKNVVGNEISFERAKTARTKREHTKIQATILPEMQEIINKYGNEKYSPETYIFPILTKGLPVNVQRDKIKLLTAQINRHMKKVAKATGVPKITTYTARHSYATILKRSGKSIEYISETLGHSDLKVTENYLKSFTEETRKENAKVLIPKKPQMEILKSNVL